MLAAQLKKSEEAFRLFRFATRMDLDNYNRNTCEGLHTTSIAAAWVNIVYGFGGMRSDGARLAFAPTLPAGWGSYSFHVTYQGAVIEVIVKRDAVSMRLLSGDPVTVDVYGSPYVLTEEDNKIPVPEAWKIK